MNKTNFYANKKNLDLNKYTNMETGETLASELDNKGTITVSQKGDKFTINSDNYVTFTKTAIDYLFRELSSTDIGKITKISNMLKTDCSIICQENNHPHTPETISFILDLHIKKWYAFVSKMVRKNILAYCVCSPSGYVQKIYMLNPYIARKRKDFNCELSSIFRDVTKDGEILEK